MERPLHVEAVGRDQVDVDGVLEGLAVELDGRNDGAHAIRIHLRRARLVRHVGDDLHRHPEPGDAREHEAVQAHVQDLLHVARVDRRDQRVPEGDLGVARQRRGLRDGIVAGEREDAAVLADARVVRMLECVAAPIHARRLAVPHAEHAVVLRPGEEAHHLAAEHRRRGEVLVQARREDDVVLGEELGIALEGLVEAAERRPAIARDERRRVEAARAVGAMLVERKPDQRLDAGEIDAAAFQGVLGIERELVGLRRHESPSETWSANRGQPNRPHGMRERATNQPHGYFYAQWPRSLPQQRAKVRPETVRDDPVALGGWVNAVALVEPRVAATPSRKNGM